MKKHNVRRLLVLVLVVALCLLCGACLLYTSDAADE